MGKTSTCTCSWPVCYFANKSKKIKSKKKTKFEKFTLCWRRPIIECFYEYFNKKEHLLPEKSFLGEFYTKLRVRGRPERNFYFFSKTHTSRLQSRTEPKFEKFTLCWRRPIIECFYEYFNKKEHLLPEKILFGGVLH